MDRRKALISMVAVLPVRLAAFEASNENSDHIDLEEGTVIAAIRYNNKTFALGFRLTPNDPHANTLKSKWLGQALSHTITLEVEK